MKVDVSKGFELGCHHFAVFDDDETTADLRARERYGECSSQNQWVRISNDYNGDQYHNTFLHELLEAVNESHCNGKMKHDVLTNCANGLAQSIKSLGVVFGGSNGNHRRDDKKKA